MSTDFDASALWNDLQREESAFRSKIKPHHKNNVDTKFWRKRRVTNEDKVSKDRWSGKKFKTRSADTNRPKSKLKINGIKHAMNLLNDQDSTTSNRIQSLHFIDQYLTNYDDDSKDDNAKLCNLEILKTAIKIFVDPKEPLRRLSIAIVQHHIGNDNEIWGYKTSIKYIIPIIVHCVLSNEYNENSEEIRLKFVYLLETIIHIASTEEEIKPICGDLLAILLKLLNDKHSEINKKVCSVIISLSTKIRLNTVSKMIIENTLELLSHRHSNVRISALQLIECMLMNGGHEAIQTLTGFREHNVVPLQWWFGGEIRANYFGALCRHSKLAVRRTFYKMIFNIMTNMLERYDYKTLLLSYVLSGLQDENKEIQTMAFEGMEKIGAMHEADDYNDLKHTLFYQTQAEEIVKKHFGEEDSDFVLPFPFTHRPCLGSRILIREHFRRIIHAALSEFKDWKDECREMAILLVRNMLVYSEEYCTQNTELLLSAFHGYIADKNVILCETSKQCCALIGKYVYPMVWMDCVCDTIYHEFDVEWIVVLQQLVRHCSMKRLSQVAKQLVSLLEYALPFIQTAHKTVIVGIVIDVLTKTSDAIKQHGTDGLLDDTNADDDFEFASNYCGFHLEIIDETDTNDAISNNKQTLKERLDALSKQYTAVCM